MILEKRKDVQHSLLVRKNPETKRFMSSILNKAATMTVGNLEATPLGQIVAIRTTTF